MPRQDVPYGGAICRLRERIAEIWDELGKKLHSINGVEGDGQGNVLIRSDSAALTITDDQLQHEIVLDLDTSQLPAAAVSSVNGQTGDVILHSSNIGADGGVSVQGAIDNLSTRVTANASAIASEQLARQNADSTLQTNINNISAGLPAAAAAAVAADPTVAYINSELNNKVDLSDVSTVETPGTIAKRNGSGRLVAADPVSGATDKTLVTANWVSQTGNGAPNNLIHRSGNETRSGLLTLEQVKYFYQQSLINTGNTASVWVQILKIPINSTRFFNFAVVKPYGVHHTLMNLRTGTSSSITLYNKYGVATSTICMKTDATYAYVYLQNGAAYQPSYVFPYFSSNVILESYVGDGSIYANIADAPGTTVINATFVGEDSA